MIEYLVHHGIKGQRWGVRRYQNADGSLTPAGQERYSRFTSDDSIKNTYKSAHGKDFVIKKNTSIQRVSQDKKERNSGRTYASFIESDNKEYINMSSEALNAKYKLDMITLKDVKVAGIGTQGKAFIDTIKNYSLEDVVNHAYPKQIGSNGEETEYSKTQRETATNMYKNMFKSKKAFDNAFANFHSKLIYDDGISKSFYENLSKKGYDALLDVNDMGGDIKSPVIFIERSKSLKTKKVSEISQSEIDEACIWLQENVWDR